MTTPQTRTVIAGGDALVGDPLTGDVLRADLLIEDGTIVAVEPDLSAVDAEVVDASGCWVIPGIRRHPPPSVADHDARASPPIGT